MRGKVATLASVVGMARITPAYAGKSLKGKRPLYEDMDHPRLCGEKSTLSIMASSDLGSPPPMRGKAVTSCIAVVISRITPAYAGKRQT